MRRCPALGPVRRGVAARAPLCRREAGFLPIEAPQLLVECFDCLVMASVLNQQRQLRDVEDAASANELVSNLKAFRSIVAVELVDFFSSSSAERVARRALQIQQAVRKNPAALDFAGLEAYMRHCHDLGGGLQTTVFDRYVSVLQKDVAAVMKQARLIEDELDARKSESGGKDKNKKRNAAAEAGKP